MKNDKIHLTFATDRKTSEILKLIAHSCKMTQPQLIEKICKDFIEELNETAKEKLKEQGVL